ncbi:single-stranded DNA-binding protein [Lactobacillus taiwanensis]|uniref:single-stranded DNA-binding protein n=1 Tax=Lactobacillus taiwanensis TaxID=508451 RepID=UPI00321F62C7
MLNNVNLIGRIASELTPNTLNDGTPVMSFQLAVSRNYKDNIGNYPTDFFTIVTFGKTVNYLSKYTAKGYTVAVSGALQQRKYQNKNGIEINVVEVRANDIWKMSAPKGHSKTTNSTSSPLDNFGNFNTSNNLESANPFSNSTIPVTPDDLPF